MASVKLSDVTDFSSVSGSVDYVFGVVDGVLCKVSPEKAVSEVVVSADAVEEAAASATSAASSATSAASSAESAATSASEAAETAEEAATEASEAATEASTYLNFAKAAAQYAGAQWFIVDTDGGVTCKQDTMVDSWYSGDTTLAGVYALEGATATSGYLAFDNCTSLAVADLGGLDTSAVTTMYRMFAFCGALTSLDVSNFDTSSVENMASMFFDCIALTSIDLSSFTTSALTTTNYMFSGCSALTTITGTIDMTSVTTCNNMFQDDESLTTVSIANLGVSLSLSSCPLDYASVTYLFENAQTVDEGTITLSSTTYALLSEDDIAVATDKGWTIAY